MELLLCASLKNQREGEVTRIQDERQGVSYLEMSNDLCPREPTNSSQTHKGNQGNKYLGLTGKQRAQEPTDISNYGGHLLRQRTSISSDSESDMGTHHGRVSPGS